MAISQTFADDEHIWRFDTPTLIATNRIEEFIGFNGLFEMDFDDLVGESSIDTVDAATISGTHGVAIGTLAVHPAKRRASIPCNCTSANAGSYLMTVTITTTDSRTFKRQGRLQLTATS